jgi:hypothetical protein
MVNSEELIDTTEHVTLYTRCLLNRCRYNRVRLYMLLHRNAHGYTQQNTNMLLAYCVVDSSSNVGPSTAKVKNEWSFTSTTLYNFVMSTRTT